MQEHGVSWYYILVVRQEGGSKGEEADGKEAEHPGGRWQVLVTTLEEISSYRIGFLPLMLMVRAVMM